MNLNETSSTNLIDEATRLAVLRTRLAAERTIMSWIRTSFAMISFGFTIIKFFQYLQILQGGNLTIARGSTHLGLFLIYLGIIILIPAIIKHRLELTQLSKLDDGPRSSFAFIVAILVGLIGIYTAVNVMQV